METTEKNERYQRIDDGSLTTGDDPERGIWYSARCSYWTDDWTKLSQVGGIPCCPRCGAVGLQTTAKDWNAGAEKFERENHPRYVEFVETQKEKCAPAGMAFLDRYQKFAERPAE